MGGGTKAEAGEALEPEGLLGEEAGHKARAAAWPWTVRPSQAGRRAHPAA